MSAATYSLTRSHLWIKVSHNPENKAQRVGIISIGTTSGRQKEGELESAVTETVSEVDTKLKMKIEGNKISKLENDTHANMSL